jgi:hypothetical protein
LIPEAIKLKILIIFSPQEQKRMEMQIAHELRQPVEDMRLKDSKDLPELTRLPNISLSGSAVADCFMIIEFTQNFKNALDLGMTFSFRTLHV